MVWDPQDDENWKHDDNPNENSGLGLGWAILIAGAGLVLIWTAIGVYRFGG